VVWTKVSNNCKRSSQVGRHGAWGRHHLRRSATVIAMVNPVLRKGLGGSGVGVGARACGGKTREEKRKGRREREPILR